ncbi:MAG: nitroreductase [Desulfobacteraceae bacterium IS3]|nr:MAG: nitroreductase [Desulfobacteraceae bacterium IS3]
MSDLAEIIRQRRSIRRYEEKAISDEAIGQILEAVQWAPSWTNCQCWEVIVIRDASVKEKLQATLAPKNPATKAITNASVLLAVCGKLGVSGFYDNKPTTKFGDWFMFDLGLATQNICLRAHDLGIGTVIVGLFDHDKAKEVLNVPAGYDVVALIPMGYPAKISAAPKRREIAEFTHYERF